jgi:hypothetical protein
MFRRTKRIKEILEIQVFSIVIAAAVIVNAKTIYGNRKNEDSSERDALW